MHTQLAQQLVQRVRQRVAQGDSPTVYALSVETLEDLVVTLADRLSLPSLTLETLKQIRLWLAEEGCEEPLELADNALRAAGVTDVACPSCHGYGEWDEGPLSARSSAQIDPEYRQVKCPDCGATGRVALTAKEAA